MLRRDLVEYLLGKQEKVVYTIDVPPPSLKLLLCLQFSSFKVNQRVVDTSLEVKLLGNIITMSL